MFLVAESIGEDCANNACWVYPGTAGEEMFWGLIAFQAQSESNYIPRGTLGDQKKKEAKAVNCWRG